MTTLKNRSIPQFKDEDDERNFWSENDSTAMVDWKSAKPIELKKLKPSVHSISLRLPDALIGKLKILANKKDVPYQTLLKVYLADRVEKEFSAYE